MFLPSSPEPREQRPQTPQLALRVAVLGTVGLFVFAVLIFRLWALQVLASDTYRARATAQQVKQVSIPAARGDIVDVNGNPLVSNRPSLELQLDPSLVSSSMARHRIILRLASLLRADPRAIWEDVDRQIRLDPLAPVTVARDVDRSVVLYLGEHAAHYPGVTVVDGEKRTYPNGRLAAHVFGQLSEITARELGEPRYQGYKAGWVIGQNGVEGTYDRWLRGEDGAKRVTIDASGTPISSLIVRGCSLGLPAPTHDRQEGAGRGRAGARERRQACAGQRRGLGRDHRDGSDHRRDPRDRLVPELRPELVRLAQPEAEPRAPALPDHGRDDAAAEPGDRRPVSRSLDVQAVHGDRRGAERRPRHTSTTRCCAAARSRSHITGSVTGIRPLTRR